MFDFQAAELNVQRHGNSTGKQRPEITQAPLRTVFKNDCNAVSFLYALTEKPSGNTQRRMINLIIGVGLNRIDVPDQYGDTLRVKTEGLIEFFRQCLHEKIIITDRKSVV